MASKRFEKENIFEDNIAKIARYDFSRANIWDANRINAISTVASVCYDNPNVIDSKSLYNRLMAESKGLPSSSFEFVPMYLDEDKVTTLRIDSGNKLESLNMIKYGMWINDGKCLITNYRAVVYDVENDRISKEWLKHYNTSIEECNIIRDNIFTFLFYIDMPTRSQMVRHRCPAQELSRRFVSGKKTPFEFYISKNMKNVVAKMKWSIVQEDISDTEIDACQVGSFSTNEIEISVTAQSAIDMCLAVYYKALEDGVKAQEARRIIPQAAYTRLWMSFNKDQLDNYLKLRLDSHSQWEIRQTAIAIKEALEIGV